MSDSKLVHEIKVWMAGKNSILISEMSFSRLSASIKYCENKAKEFPNADLSQLKYPKGTTYEVLLQVLNQERTNRRLKKNIGLFA